MAKTGSWNKTFQKDKNIQKTTQKDFSWSESGNTAKQRGVSYKDLSALPQQYKTSENYAQNNYVFDPAGNAQILAAQTAKQGAQSAVANHNPYRSQYSTKISETLDAILNRKAFNYDFNADALYQQYKDQYTEQGKLAAQNAAAAAAANSGGYGNSYGTVAASLANQEYMTKLNDRIPELYQIARENYDREGNELYNRANLLGTQDDREYGRWVDEDSRLRSDRDYYTDDYYNTFSREQGLFQNNYENALNLFNTGVNTYGKDVSENTSKEESYSGQTNETSSKTKQTGTSTQTTSGGSVSTGSGKTKTKNKTAKPGKNILTADEKATIKKLVQNDNQQKAYLLVQRYFQEGKIHEDDVLDTLDQYGITYDPTRPHKAWKDWQHSAGEPQKGKNTGIMRDMLNAMTGSKKKK